MDIVSLFAVISSIILLGYISGYIFKKTGIPDVLILIGVGVVIRYGFKWLDPENLGAGSSVFTTFALIFLLFQGALNIDIKTLFESLSYVLKLTILHFILSLGVIFGIVFFISGSVPASLIAAFILAGTSSAVVIPLINNIDIKERYGTILTMESAITDVLCIIGVLTLVRIFSPGSGVLPSEIFRSVLVSFALAIFVGVIIGYFWVLLLSKHEDLISAHILTIGIVMGVYAFVQSPLVSGSGAIAALTFGIVLGNSRSILKFRYRKKNKAIEARAAKVRSVKKKERILDRKISHNVLNTNAKSFYEEISFFIKIFFFVYIGILLDFSNLWLIFIGFLITMAVYMVRPISVWFAFRKKEIDRDVRVILEALIPKGLAAVVLAQFVVSSGILGSFATDLVGIILSVILISIVFTSFFIFLSDKKFYKGLLGMLYKE